MLAVVGTIPDKKFPLVSGEVVLQDNELRIQGYSSAIQRGTPALIAAAVKTLDFLKKPHLFVYLVGDIGRGDGSHRLYEHITHHIGSADFSTITFH